VLLAAGALAARADDPDRAAAQRAIEASHPSRDWIVGWGQGSTRDDAQKRAIADAAAAVRSELRAATRSLERESSSGGRSERKVEAESVVELRATTEWAAYFRPVETLPAGDGFVVAVAASRAELRRAIELAGEQPLRRARAALAAIDAAPSWLEASAPACDLVEAVAAVDDLEPQLLAVSRARLWTQADQDARRRVEARRREVRDRVVVTVSGQQPADAPLAPARLVEELARAGWKAQISDAPCGGRTLLGLSLEAKSDCRTSSLGFSVCRASLGVVLRRCADGVVVGELRSGDAEERSTVGEAAALRKALGRVAAEPLPGFAARKVSELLGGPCLAAPARDRAQAQPASMPHP
jgi:hypothetical protein